MTELEISFRPGGNSAGFVREGWGEVETGGRWMVGPQSRLVIPPPPWAEGPFFGQLLVGPFIQEGIVAAQRVSLRVNDVPVAQWRLTHAAELSFTVPPGVIRADAGNHFVFVHDDATAPGLVQPGGDLRALSLSTYSFTLFGPERPPDAAAPPPRPAGMAPVLRLRARGNLGNRMIQYMVGLAIQQRVPNCVLAGVELDEWGLTTQGDQPDWADHAVVDDQAIDLEAVAERLRQPGTRKIAYRGYGQRMENFLPVEAYRPLFRAPPLDVIAYDDRHLVINVRAGDVLDGHAPDYVMMPPGFYRPLIARTGLIPVFMGQLEPNPYSQALRATYPGARFVPSQGPLRDFETLRQAKNIVLSVSTFSWVAAWLSHAERIFMPVNGIFNPLQFPPVDLLPLDDPRYEFHLFPINTAVPLDRLAAAHAALDGQWRRVDPGELKALLDQPGGRPSGPPSRAAAAEHPVMNGVTWMYEANDAILRAAEAQAANGSVIELLERLRGLSIADFADLMWSLPHAGLPHISRLLPRMASTETQLGWTGKAGIELLQHTVDFCRIVGLHYQAIRGRPLYDERVLDFGCGHGRIARVLYWFTNPENYHGVDPMPQSLQVCREDGVLGNFHLVDYLPDSIPPMGGPFGLIFAYSVFTHTSADVTRTALRHLRAHARATTVLVMTIRPVEHWHFDTSAPPEVREAAIAEHRRSGFAFRPHNMTDSAGRQVFGENSMTTEWLAAEIPQWTVVGHDRGLDPFQTILFLVPR